MYALLRLWARLRDWRAWEVTDECPICETELNVAWARGRARAWPACHEPGCWFRGPLYRTSEVA